MGHLKVTKVKIARTGQTVAPRPQVPIDRVDKTVHRGPFSTRSSALAETRGNAAAALTDDEQSKWQKRIEDPLLGTPLREDRWVSVDAVLNRTFYDLW